MSDFVGVKIALFFNNQLIACLRDDKPNLPFANMWDFPGGGKENGEIPMDCATREVREEFSINLDPASVIWQKEYPSMSQPAKIGYFMVAKVSQDQFDGIVFGDEGQKWQLMSVDEFLSRNDVVPHLKGRLQDYLTAQK